MNIADKYRHLMGGVDKYISKDKAANQDPFNFLREEVEVSHFMTTQTFSASAEGLKTYFVNLKRSQAYKIIELWFMNKKFIEIENPCG